MTLKLADVKAGDILITDAGFSCMKAGAEHVVRADEKDGKLYVSCNDGRHFLDGQVDSGGMLIGLTRKSA